MKKIIIAICIIIISAVTYAQSGPLQASNGNKQTGTGVVKGRIIEASTNTPLEYASVALFAKQNSMPVNGMFSDKKGEFNLKGIPNGIYNLKITFVGYKTNLVENIQISDNNGTVDLKDVKLQLASVTMKEVEVVGERSAIEFHVDKKVVNVSQNLAAAGGTAVDVLQNQPSVQVDANGNLTLRGSGNFSVTVDGRPSVLQGTDALRQIPANIIDNIELITNPSAKYDAEGTAGIINIVTKKTNTSSTSGIFNAGIGSRDKYNSDGNVSFRTDDYYFSLGGDIRRNNNVQTVIVDRTQFDVSGVNSSAEVSQLRNNYNGRISFDKYFNESMTLGLNAAYGYMDMNLGVNTFNNVTGLPGNNPISNSLTNDRTKVTVEYINGSVNFTNIFKPKVNDLYFEAVFTKLRQPTEVITSEYITPANSSLQNIRNGRDEDVSRFNSRIKLNYKHNIAEKNTFESGLQAVLFNKETDITSKTFDFNTQTWTKNTLYSNSYNFRNNIYSAYSTYTDKIFGIDYQLGLRLEYTDRIFELIASGNQFNYQKLHLFPTINFSSAISPDQQVQLSYSRRIQRPGEGQLNPSTNYSDSYSTIIGNPYLLPSFTHAVEINYQKSFPGVFLTLQTYLRKTDDGIDQTQRLDNTSGKIILSQENLLNTTSIGAELMGNITFAPWLKMDPAVNLYNFNLEEKKELDVMGQNRFTWDARINTTMFFSASTRLQFFVNYFPDRINSQGEMKSFMIIGASFRQEFFEKQLIATFSAQNLFNQTKFTILSSGTGYTSNVFARPEAPVFNLTLSYNFNNFRRRNTEQVDVNVSSGFMN